MNVKTHKLKQYFPAILSFTIIMLIIALIINPAKYINSVYNGLIIWATCVLPSLLPFMFFTKILTNLKVVTKISTKFSKVTRKLFKAPSISAYIFLMSVISGYPVGAKLISDFYSAGYLTKKQANKLTTFCSTSGPLFIIGSVGTVMFVNAKLGYIMFASHIISSVLNGILFRRAYCDNTETEVKLDNNVNLNNLLPESMSSSIMSVLIVGGYVAIFFLIIDILNSFNILYPINMLLQFILQPFNLSLNAISGLTSGIIEISKGCSMLSICALPLTTLGVLGSFLISFGGFSVHFQALTFLSNCEVNFKFYIFQKFVHAILSALLTLLFCLLLF